MAKRARLPDPFLDIMREELRAARKIGDEQGMATYAALVAEAVDTKLKPPPKRRRDKPLTPRGPRSTAPKAPIARSPSWSDD